MKLAQAAQTPAQWNAFERHGRAEMSAPAARHDLDLLATWSAHANFSVGYYCEREDRCHRSLLRELLHERSARLA